ncbi:uncharacterized protein [Triticum aestivum]|uniref:uncharacterized protein isoform X4 n=1 Tax=Triticum aestivum TaxID=4565 RepID=UPI001D009A52|nr:uncharacterized protein LOC123128586 isoform X4 [Triticum aestivum]
MGRNGMGPTYSQASFSRSVRQMDRNPFVPPDRIFGPDAERGETSKTAGRNRSPLKKTKGGTAHPRTLAALCPYPLALPEHKGSSVWILLRRLAEDSQGGRGGFRRADTGNIGAAQHLTLKCCCSSYWSGVPALMNPRRRARSDDPAWKYGFWPDLERKDLLQCTLCGKIIHAGVKRLKQHLSGGSSDADKCPEASMEIRIEMRNSLNSGKFKAIERYIDEEDEAEVQRRRSVMYPR